VEDILLLFESEKGLFKDFEIGVWISQGIYLLAVFLPLKI